MRRATIVDVPDLNKIDKSDSTVTFINYIRSPYKLIYISRDRRAYVLYEFIHPFDKVIVHYNGNLKGKKAKEFMQKTVRALFMECKHVRAIIGIFPSANKKLRFLISKIEGVKYMGNIDSTQESIYTLEKGV